MATHLSDVFVHSFFSRVVCEGAIANRHLQEGLQEALVSGAFYVRVRLLGHTLGINHIPQPPLHCVVLPESHSRAIQAVVLSGKRLIEVAAAAARSRCLPVGKRPCACLRVSARAGMHDASVGYSVEWP